MQQGTTDFSRKCVFHIEGKNMSPICYFLVEVFILGVRVEQTLILRVLIGPYPRPLMPSVHALSAIPGVLGTSPIP